MVSVLWFYQISVRLGVFSDDFVYFLNVALSASSNFYIFVTVRLFLMGLIDPVLFFLRLSNMSSMVDLLAMIRQVWKEMRYVSQSMGTIAKAMTITPIMKFRSWVPICQTVIVCAPIPMHMERMAKAVKTSPQNSKQSLAGYYKGNIGKTSPTKSFIARKKKIFHILQKMASGKEKI